MEESLNFKLIHQFLDYFKIKHPGSVSTYYYALVKIARWCDEKGRNLNKLIRSDFLSYLNEIGERNLKDSTRASYMTPTRALFRWMREEGLCSLDEKLIPVPEVTDGESYNPVTPEEVQKMLKECDEFFPQQLRNKAIIAFLADTGIRKSELCSLVIRQINPYQITKEGVFEGEVRTFKRKNHYRPIFWSKETNEILLKYIQVREKVLSYSQTDTNFLWIVIGASLGCKKAGEALAARSVDKIFRIVTKNAGVTRRITPHSMRHGYATAKYRETKDIRSIQELLGHAKITSTQIYAHIEREDLRKVHSRQSLVHSAMCG